MWNPFQRKVAHACQACASPNGKKRGVVAMALLCAHCSLTALAAIATIALASAPTLFGIGLEWILPPFFILGLFAFLLWPSKPVQHNHPADHSQETHA